MLRLTILFTLAAAGLAWGAGKLTWIERTQGDDLRRSGEKQQSTSITIPAQRGDILDVRGRELAISSRHPSIYVDSWIVEDPRFAAYTVAPALHLNPADLEQFIRENKEKRDRFAWVKRSVSREELHAFQAACSARRLRAFGVINEPRRAYPYGALAAHVLGFVSADQRGLAGVEQLADSLLHGRDGRRVATVDGHRKWLKTDDEDYVPPRDGATVVLTIDSSIQQAAEQHLKSAVEQFKAFWGAAIVLDPQSGEILAMATYPAFDPANPLPSVKGDLKPEDLEELRNRAIADSYEPGSIFKPFVGALALDEHVTNLEETFSINGPARAFGSRIIHDTHPYGVLPFHQVISKSSNIGMALLGNRLGNERLYRYVRSYGFGDLTGLGLPGEHPGLLNDFSKWTSFSTNSIPMGQEIAVTALQVVTGFSVFCNGGVLYRPRIIRGIIDADGGTLLDNSRPIAVRRVIDAQTAESFRLGALVETVISGTGKSAAMIDYQSFGKTGTAQVSRGGGGGYLDRQFVGSFVGGAPAGNPRVAAIVSIYRPQANGHYGGTVAAPAVRDILADALHYMHVPKDDVAPAPPESMPGSLGD